MHFDTYSKSAERTVVPLTDKKMNRSADGQSSSAHNRRPPIAVKSSTIHGKGVFATRKIAADTRLIEYEGERITEKQAAKRRAEDGFNAGCGIGARDNALAPPLVDDRDAMRAPIFNSHLLVSQARLIPGDRPREAGGFFTQTCH